MIAVTMPLLTLAARLAMGFRPGDAPMVILFIIPTIVAAYLGGLGPGLTATLMSGALTDYFLLMQPGGTPIVSSLRSTQWLAFLVVGSLVSVLTEALHVSRQRFHAILESALDAIVVIDHEGRIVEFNPAAERMFGHAARDVLGRNLGEVIVPPAMRERHHQGLARYLATGEARVLGRRTEMSALRADGKEFPVEVSIQRIAGANPPRFTGFIRDVTERRRTEEAMQRSEAILAQAQQIAHIGSWDLDLANLDNVNVNPLRWSEELYRLFGYEP
ncbi:PAS domain S-box protein, partial [Devosia sp.]|uniref:PAS domain S-box protein n=1 Tax=Devosia sp. TaxID=1871048 RepID=UPI00261E1E12